MEARARYRGYVVLSLVYSIILGGYVLYDRWPRPAPMQIIEPTLAPVATEAPMQVHVAGAVQSPGVYALLPGSRVVQAIQAAGGLAPSADQESVNLADPLRDGQQVYIPHKGTPPPPLATSVGGAAAVRAAPAAQVDGVVNINTASAVELATLPGIGPALAERIIAYRQSQGPFADPAQITEVKGIGQATYERIRGRIVVR